MDAYMDEYMLLGLSLSGGVEKVVWWKAADFGCLSISSLCDNIWRL
jgi:hypothetical protein